MTTLESIKALSALGVRRFEQRSETDWSVEFFPPSPAPLDPIAQFKADHLPTAEGEKPCKCSHGLEAHGERGLCLMGCDAERCGVEEEEPA